MVILVEQVLYWHVGHKMSLIVPNSQGSTKSQVLFLLTRQPTLQYSFLPAQFLDGDSLFLSRSSSCLQALRKWADFDTSRSPKSDHDRLFPCSFYMLSFCMLFLPPVFCPHYNSLSYQLSWAQHWSFILQHVLQASLIRWTTSRYIFSCLMDHVIQVRAVYPFTSRPRTATSRLMPMILLQVDTCFGTHFWAHNLLNFN